MFAQLGYRKKKVGASWNEGFVPLFIVEQGKGAKEALKSNVGHLYMLEGEVLRLLSECGGLEN